MLTSVNNNIFLPIEKNYDPIDYESINKIDFWVFEEEEEPFIDHDEIENLLYEDLEGSKLQRQHRHSQLGHYTKFCICNGFWWPHYT